MQIVTSAIFISPQWNPHLRERWAEAAEQHSRNHLFIYGWPNLVYLQFECTLFIFLKETLQDALTDCPTTTLTSHDTNGRCFGSSCRPNRSRLSAVVTLSVSPPCWETGSRNFHIWMCSGNTWALKPFLEAQNTLVRRVVWLHAENEKKFLSQLQDRQSFLHHSSQRPSEVDWLKSQADTDFRLSHWFLPSLSQWTTHLGTSPWSLVLNSQLSKSDSRIKSNDRGTR